MATTAVAAVGSIAVRCGGTEVGTISLEDKDGQPELDENMVAPLCQVPAGTHLRYSVDGDNMSAATLVPKMVAFCTNPVDNTAAMTRVGFDVEMKKGTKRVKHVAMFLDVALPIAPVDPAPIKMEKPQLSKQRPKKRRRDDTTRDGDEESAGKKFRPYLAAPVKAALVLCARDATGELLNMTEALAAQQALVERLKAQSASPSSPSSADVAKAADPADGKAALLGGEPCGAGAMYRMCAFACAGAAVGAGDHPYIDGTKEFSKKVGNYKSALSKLHKLKTEMLKQWRLTKEDPAAELIGADAQKFVQEYGKDVIKGAANAEVVQSYFDYHYHEDALLCKDGGKLRKHCENLEKWQPDDKFVATWLPLVEVGRKAMGNSLKWSASNSGSSSKRSSISDIDLTTDNASLGAQAPSSGGNVPPADPPLDGKHTPSSSGSATSKRQKQQQVSAKLAEEMKTRVETATAWQKVVNAKPAGKGSKKLAKKGGDSTAARAETPSGSDLDDTNIDDSPPSPKGGRPKRGKK